MPDADSPVVKLTSPSNGGPPPRLAASASALLRRKAAGARVPRLFGGASFRMYCSAVRDGLNACLPDCPARWWEPRTWWGGPLVDAAEPRPLRDSFFPNITLHGLTRVYEPGSGAVRSLTWLAAVIVAIYFSYFFVAGNIRAYLDYDIDYNQYIDWSRELQPQPLPNVTLCPWQPVTCKCPLFYEDFVLDNLEYTYPVLSLACPEAFDLAFFPAYPRKVTDSGRVFIDAGDPGVTVDLLNELGLPNTTSPSYSYDPGNWVDDLFWLDPDLGLGAKRYCPESFWGDKGSCRYGGDCNCGTEAKKQADLFAWRNATSSAVRVWYAQQDTYEAWDCESGLYGQDVPRTEARQRLEAQIQNAVAEKKEVALNMSDLYVYAAHGSTFLNFQSADVTCALGRQAEEKDAETGFTSHCALLNKTTDGIDGRELLPDFHSPAARIDPVRGVCQTINLAAIPSGYLNDRRHHDDAITIRGWMDV